MVHHEKNRGYGAALTSGFASATKDYVFYTDGDGQYDPAEIKLLADEMKPGIDVVNGYKRSRQDPWYRSVAGGAYQQAARSRCSRCRSGTSTATSALCDAKSCETSSCRATTARSAWSWCASCATPTRQMVELPVSHYLRAFGTSQFFKPVRIARAVQGVIRWYVRLVLLREQKRRVATLEKRRMLPLADPLASKSPE